MHHSSSEERGQLARPACPATTPAHPTPRERMRREGLPAGGGGCCRSLHAFTILLNNYPRESARNPKAELSANILSRPAAEEASSFPLCQIQVRSSAGSGTLCRRIR